MPRNRHDPIPQANTSPVDTDAPDRVSIPRQLDRPLRLMRRGRTVHLKVDPTSVNPPAGGRTSVSPPESGHHDQRIVSAASLRTALSPPGTWRIIGRSSNRLTSASANG